jgi:hypothetical protein
VFSECKFIVSNDDLQQSMGRITHKVECRRRCRRTQSNVILNPQTFID